MNELIEFWNTLGLTAWFMDMSLLNIGMLIFIALSVFGLSLTVTVDGNKNNRPKWLPTILTFILMYLYPHTLWIAAIPFGLVLLLLIIWQKPVFVYMNLYLPKGRKLDI